MLAPSCQACTKNIPPLRESKKGPDDVIEFPAHRMRQLEAIFDERTLAVLGPLPHPLCSCALYCKNRDCRKSGKAHVMIHIQVLK